jgi:putative transposase
MRRREHHGDIRFITFSCERRLPLLGSPDARDIFVRSLREVRTRSGMELFAWVAMPEHVHLLVRPPEGLALALILKSLKLSATQRLLRFLTVARDPLAREILRPDGSPRVWQKGGGFDRNVRSDAEFQREVRYTHRNPVTTNLITSPEKWRWSSAHWWTARQQEREQDPADVPCDWPPGDPRSWAMWLGYK